MVRCSECNKRIGLFELMTKTEDKTYCSDCIVKDKSILLLIQDANKMLWKHINIRVL